MHFQVQLDAAQGTIPIFAEPSITGTLVTNLAAGREVESDETIETPPGWSFVKAPRFLHDPKPTQGWIELRFLTGTAAPAPIAVDPKRFVRACVRTELDLNAGENLDSFPIVADYLIAWSLIETGMTNKPANPEHDNAGGPFALTDAQWAAYLDPATGAAKAGASARFRLWPDMHAYAAAFIAQEQMEAFSRENSIADAPDGPYVPSYLNVLLSQLFGVTAATAIDKAAAAGGAQPAEEVLQGAIPDQVARDKLIARRRAHLPAGITVEALVKATEKLLDEKLVEADKLIRKHFPEVVPPAETLTGEAPWFTIAESEFKSWKDGNLIESSGDGKTKVLDYFRSTDSGITRVVAWCGAFVAHCLAKSGAAQKGSIVRTSALAAQWKRWGNAELKLTPGAKIPKGAIVVTVPLAKDASGHVGFFNREVPGGVELLGGNQSNRVSLMTVPRSKVVTIRWCDFGQGVAGALVAPGAASSGGTVPIPSSATEESEVLTLARTLYGEARGQGQRGIEAVANVVMNRAASGRWGGKVGSVCLWPWQFSCWNRNDPNFQKIRNKTDDGTDNDFKLCLVIARKAVSGGLPQHVPGALHYYADYIRTPNWVSKSPNARMVAKIGRHLFWAGIR
jgi:uncharacterized protein (TIGR02594 family)